MNIRIVIIKNNCMPYGYEYIIYEETTSNILDQFFTQKNYSKDLNGVVESIGNILILGELLSDRGVIKKHLVKKILSGKYTLKSVSVFNKEIE